MTDIAGKPASATLPACTHAGTAAQDIGSAAAARNARLQYLRGLAAITVLLYHVSSYVHHLRGDDRYLAVFSGFWGAFGVAVFFVLSGYLMAGLSRRADPWRFLLERILRIYPLMLIVLAISMLAFFVTGFARRPDLVAMTLVPAGPRDYFLGVEWTLLFEMTYYVVIAVMAMLGMRRLLEPIFAAWLGTLLAIALLGHAPPEMLTPTFSQLPGQAANSAFLMGFLLPLILHARWLPSSRVLCLSAIPAAALFLVLPASCNSWVAALSATLLVAGALKAPPVDATGPLHGLGMRLGDASYALYLCHVPIIMFSINLLPPSLPTALLWMGWSAAALAAALCLGPLDLNLHQRLKRWARALPGNRVTALSLGFVVLFAGIAGYSDVTGRWIRKAESAARTALATAKPAPLPTVLAAIDSTTVLQDGRLVVRGYGIDLASPDDDGHIAIEQGGSVIALDRMRRMRPRIAEAASRPDIASIRFGFAAVTDAPLDCARGLPAAKFILPDGRVMPIAADLLDAVCSQDASSPDRKP